MFITALATALLCFPTSQLRAEDLVRPPYPEKGVSARTFTARIPTHWNARRVEYRGIDDWLEITDIGAHPIDKYYRRGEHPGRIRVSIQLKGTFDGVFPTPGGATGEGKPLQFKGVHGKEWIHTSASPHELGKMRTVMIELGSKLYSLNYFIPEDTAQNGVIDRIIVSLKPKRNGK